MAEGGSPAPAVARHRLRFALREARDAAGLTQRQVATRLEWSMAKVNRIEAGDVTISATDLHALLRLLGVDDRGRIEELTALARASRQRGWWDEPEFRSHLTPATVELVQFEADATLIRAFHPKVFPGPLQTYDYAAAIYSSAWSDHLSEADVAARVKTRSRRRRQIFDRAEPPQFLTVLDESVLMRQVGGPRTLSDQLFALLEQTEAEQTTVRVLPFAHPGSFAAFGHFIVCETPDDAVAMVYREFYETDESLVDPAEVDRHRRLFDQIWEQALDHRTSREMIEASATAMRLAASRRGG